MKFVLGVADAHTASSSLPSMTGRTCVTCCALRTGFVSVRDVAGRSLVEAAIRVCASAAFVCESTTERTIRLITRMGGDLNQSVSLPKGALSLAAEGYRAVRTLSGSCQGNVRELSGRTSEEPKRTVFRILCDIPPAGP
jgi:hypothetical protein